MKNRKTRQALCKYNVYLYILYILYNPYNKHENVVVLGFLSPKIKVNFFRTSDSKIRSHYANNKRCNLLFFANKKKKQLFDIFNYDYRERNHFLSVVLTYFNYDLCIFETIHIYILRPIGRIDWNILVV